MILWSVIFYRHIFCGSQITAVNAVAAMDLESISATEAIWPVAGLEPSRLGKFLVLWRMQKSLFPGASEAPKQGPQKAVFTLTP